MNEQSAKEWLIKAWHNLSSAKILYNADHYTDTIAIELHYAVEKMLKSFLAYENRKIPKKHDLNEIHSFIVENISFNESEFELLDIISGYHIEASYPQYHREMPNKEEIEEVLNFSEKLFDKVCLILNMNRQELTQ